jgi:hypothetical protein
MEVRELWRGDRYVYGHNTGDRFIVYIFSQTYQVVHIRNEKKKGIMSFLPTLLFFSSVTRIRMTYKEVVSSAYIPK